MTARLGGLRSAVVHQIIDRESELINLDRQPVDFLRELRVGIREKWISMIEGIR